MLIDAIAAIRSVNAAGLKATLDYLGENVYSESGAASNANEYIRALEAIHEAGLDANVSIKLTAMGLAVDDGFCYENVRRIVSRAADLDNFVRIDMEDSAVTGRTLDIYRRLRQDFANAGIVLQSYLYRSQSDVGQLMADGMAHIRLCKGAYDEPASVAFQAKKDVDNNLFSLAKTMLDGLDDLPGITPAIASHDHMIINRVRAYAYRRDISPDRYEFQMLYGIRRDLQKRLVDQGHKVRVYIPYGASWYPYFMRRLAERPANLLFFLRALLGE